MIGEVLLVGVAITLILVAIQFWITAYENGKLKELVKQKDEEIEELQIKLVRSKKDRN